MAASPELVKLRGKLSDKLSKIWELPEAEEFKKILGKMFTEKGKKIYADCMEGKIPPGEEKKEIMYKCWQIWTDSQVACLYVAAKHLKLEDNFKKAWITLPKDIRFALLGIADTWGDKEKAEIKSVFKTLDISRLYKLCVRGKYEDVKKELNLGFAPVNYSTCLSCVAAAKDLSEALKSKWGKL